MPTTSTDLEPLTEKTVTPADIFINNKKWIFLALLCFSQLGQLYNAQAMPTLQVPFQRDMGMSETDYSLLVVFETVPGFVFPLIGGYFVDLIGASKSFLATNVFIILGQSICTLATYEKSFWTFVAGKFIFNSAAEAATLARSKIVGIWYVNNDIGKALGAAVVLQTLAGVVCDLVYPNLYESTQSLGFPFLMGVFVCLVGAVICILCLLVHRQLLMLRGPGAEKKEGNDKISYRVIRRFPPMMWLLLGAASLGVDAFIIVKLYVSKWLQESYSFSISDAGSFLAASQIVTGVATPLAGLMTDKVGKLPIFLIISIGLIQSGVFISLIIPKCNQCYLPAIPIVLLSMGLGPILVSGYGSLLRLIHEKELGIATAMIPVVISAEMIVFALIAGQVSNYTWESAGPAWVFLMALIIGLSGLAVGFVAHFYDLRHGSKLQTTTIIKPEPLLEEEEVTTTALLDGSDTSSVRY